MTSPEPFILTAAVLVGAHISFGLSYWNSRFFPFSFCVSNFSPLKNHFQISLPKVQFWSFWITWARTLVVYQINSGLTGLVFRAFGLTSECHYSRCWFILCHQPDKMSVISPKLFRLSFLCLELLSFFTCGNHLPPFSPQFCLLNIIQDWFKCYVLHSSSPRSVCKAG